LPKVLRNAYTDAVYSLTEFTLDENYSRARDKFQIIRSNIEMAVTSLQIAQLH